MLLFFFEICIFKHFQVLTRMNVFLDTREIETSSNKASYIFKLSLLRIMRILYMFII